MQAANPIGYYDAINGKRGEALKTALATVLLNHTVHDYGSLWTFFRSTDVRDDGTIWDMYSDTRRTSTQGMNREHAFPKSWWGGDVNAAYTDINHLYPADASANTAKNNYALGVVGQATFNNGVSKVGRNVFPGYATDALVFEPDDAYKGDFARTYFYMVTCYQHLQWRYTYMVEQNTYPTLKPWAIQLLLAWHRQDPVSPKEIDRNEAVFRIQNNRNPFIDYPELAEYLWGDHAGEAFTLAVTSRPVLSTPTNETELVFGPTIVGNARQHTLYIKGASLNAPLSLMVEPVDDHTHFSTPVRTVTAAQGNAGYQLNLSYHPTVTGDHNASLLVYDGGIEGSVKVHLRARAIPADSLLPPTVLPATQVRSTGFVARWQPASYADTYRLHVYVLLGSSLQLFTTLEGLPETECEVDGLVPGHTYAYTVQSCNGGYDSPASDEIPVTLLTDLRRPDHRTDLRLYTASNTLYYQAPVSGEAVNVYHLTGRRVASERSTGHLQVLSGLAPGIYVLVYEGHNHTFRITD